MTKKIFQAVNEEIKETFSDDFFRLIFIANSLSLGAIAGVGFLVALATISLNMGYLLLGDKNSFLSGVGADSLKEVFRMLLFFAFLLLLSLVIWAILYYVIFCLSK